MHGSITSSSAPKLSLTTTFVQVLADGFVTVTVIVKVINSPTSMMPSPSESAASTFLHIASVSVPGTLDEHASGGISGTYPSGGCASAGLNICELTAIVPATKIKLITIALILFIINQSIMYDVR